MTCFSLSLSLEEYFSACLEAKAVCAGTGALSVGLCGRTEGGSSRGEAELGARGCGRVAKAGEGHLV